MIEVQDIFKVYENGTPALKKVSFVLPSCGLVALVGTSGSGKSTLLNILSNNDTVSKGQVLYKGKPYEEYKKAELTKDFAYIYQDFKLIENMTVFQNIAIGYELANENLQYDFVLQIAKKLGLENLLDQKVYSLSGGQQQRVAIARALARNPKVIFADEPTGNLDTANSEKVYNILKSVSQEILVVIVTHDETIENYADNIIKLDNGRVVLQKQCETNSTANQIFNTNANRINNNLAQSNNAQQYKDKTRKKSGLSTKSTLALTLAFNNYGTTKKVVLVAISCVMLAVIFFTLMVLMSNTETVFCRLMKEKEEPFIKYVIDFDRNSKKYYQLNQQEMDQINNFVEERCKTTPVKGGDHNLNGYLSFHIKEDNVDLSEEMFLKNCRAVYTNTPSDLGLNIVKGVAPKINSDGIDEIAISKTFYEYFLKYKKFKNNEGEELVFNSEKDLLGKYIKEFNLTITGVFDDKNNLSVEEFMKQGLDKSRADLVFTIIRPQESASLLDFATENERDYLLVSNLSACNTKMYPNTKSIQKYFYKQIDKEQMQLAENEIIINDNFFVNTYEKAFNVKLKEGDEIPLTFAEVSGHSLNPVIKKEIKPSKVFKIKHIVSSGECDKKGIIVNDKVYNEYCANRYLETSVFAINSKNITPKALKDIRRYVYYDISDEIAQIVRNDWEKTGFNLSFDISHYTDNEYNNSVIRIIKLPVALPLFFLSLVAFTIISTVLVSDMLKIKGKDILILKSFGAKAKDIIKIFILIVVAILMIQVMLGTAISYGFTYALNTAFKAFNNNENYIATFYLSAESIVLMVVAIIGVYTFSLWFNNKKLSDKNLRKAFQKTKE